MSKEVVLSLPKFVVELDVPDGATHQHIMDALTADGFIDWLKTQVRNKKPAGSVIDSWTWALKTSLGRTEGENEETS